MHNLQDLQNEFQTYLMHSQGNLANNVVDTKYLSAATRMNVYHAAYRARLFEVLTTDYPKLAILLGEHDFFETCMQYIDAYPSKHFSVRYFGSYFEQFLLENLPYKNYPFLAEMANFEWALMHSLDAPDDTIATMEHLQAFSSEQWPFLQFHLHPTVQLQQYHWDTPSLWNHIAHELPPREPKQLDAIQPCLFWRKGLESVFESLNSIQYRLYNAILQQATLSDMAESLSEILEPNEVPQVLLQNLQYWISQNLFTKIYLAPS